jgi:Glycosyl transferase family 2
MRRWTILGALVLSVSNFFLWYFRLRSQVYYPRETTTTAVHKTVHNLTIYDGNNSFAACLLVMDDNHYLTEWLAYHYHVLPLRHLIVAVDPRSRTSPAEILNRWQDAMDITVWWNDTDFVTNATEFEEAELRVQFRFRKINPPPDVIRHRARQRLFYYHCMQEHKRANIKWTLLTDTDEFLAVNYATVRALRNNDNETTGAQPISEPGSVLKLLYDELQYYPENNLTSSPCIQIPRVRFGAVETNSTFIQASIPDDLLPNFNASHLATLRWRKHTAPANYKLNRVSKAIVDLSRVDWRNLEPDYNSDGIHRPVNEHCDYGKLYIRSDQQLVLIHHYLGTWEQFSFRNDPRTEKERSQSVSNGCVC